MYRINKEWKDHNNGIEATAAVVAATVVVAAADDDDTEGRIIYSLHSIRY